MVDAAAAEQLTDSQQKPDEETSRALAAAVTKAAFASALAAAAAEQRSAIHLQQQQEPDEGASRALAAAADEAEVRSVLDAAVAAVSEDLRGQSPLLARVKPEPMHFDAALGDADGAASVADALLCRVIPASALRGKLGFGGEHRWVGSASDCCLL